MKSWSSEDIRHLDFKNWWRKVSRGIEDSEEPEEFRHEKTVTRASRTAGSESPVVLQEFRQGGFMLLKLNDHLLDGLHVYPDPTPGKLTRDDVLACFDVPDRDRFDWNPKLLRLDRPARCAPMNLQARQWDILERGTLVSRRSDLSADESRWNEPTRRS